MNAAQLQWTSFCFLEQKMGAHSPTPLSSSGETPKERARTDDGLYLEPKPMNRPSLNEYDP
jgi:hypothetical protein